MALQLWMIILLGIVLTAISVFLQRRRGGAD
jgi:hypothetical protein